MTLASNFLRPHFAHLQNSFKFRLTFLRLVPILLGMSKTHEEQRIARMIRELQSHLADMVEAGEMTAAEANEWVNYKTEQWAKGLS